MTTPNENKRRAALQRYADPAERAKTAAAIRAGYAAAPLRGDRIAQGNRLRHEKRRTGPHRDAPA